MTDNDRQTEDKIFESATEVFVEKGMDGARMKDIADRAGINKALLHYYFRSKEHLFSAVFEKIAFKMFSKFAPVFDEGLTLEEKIGFFFREHISFLQKNPGLPAFLLNEINRHPERIRNLLRNIDLTKIWQMLFLQHKEELSKYDITPESFPQVMTTIVAISVFPFAARGILEGFLDKLEIDFDDFLEQRKSFAAGFVIKGISKGA